jgi:hypothetical protein
MENTNNQDWANELNKKLEEQRQAYKESVDTGEVKKRKNRSSAALGLKTLIERNPNHQSKAGKSVKPESMSRRGKIGGKIAGQKAKESGRASALGKKYGAENGRKNLTKYIKENPEEHKKQASLNGQKGGQKNVESGHIQALGRKNGPLNAAKFAAENPEKAFAIRSKAGKANAEKIAKEFREVSEIFYNMITTNDWFTQKDILIYLQNLSYPRIKSDQKLSYKLLTHNKDLFESKKGNAICNGKNKSVNLYRKINLDNK